MKEIIELPEMVKRYPNGKTIKTVSNFTDEKEPFFEMLPKWFNEDMIKTENSYNNPFDEYLFDLL